MDISVQKILGYLKQKRGFDFSGYSKSLIKKQITQRLNSNNLPTIPAYFNFIQNNPTELDQLINNLTINVTHFFRNTISFVYFEKYVLPTLITNKIKDREHALRIWSAGCASGDEPYSAAILINEELIKNNFQFDVSIFATDFDKNILHKAKKAIFNFDSVKNIKYYLLKKYFNQKNKQYLLNKNICKMVNFSFYDMLDQKTHSPPLSVYGDFDIIFCCNLLIYYEKEQQDLIFKKLYRSLPINGYLILGEAEIPVNSYQRHFKQVCDFCHIYQKIS